MIIMSYRRQRRDDAHYYEIIPKFALWPRNECEDVEMEKNDQEEVGSIDVGSSDDEKSNKCGNDVDK